jgi:hypothetical protein
LEGCVAGRRQLNEIGDHHAGRYTKIGRGGRVYAVAMGSGFVPWRNLRVPVELESTCGANLGWGRAEGGRKREKRKESLFHS